MQRPYHFLNGLQPVYVILAVGCLLWPLLQNLPGVVSTQTPCSRSALLSTLHDGASSENPQLEAAPQVGRYGNEMHVPPDDGLTDLGPRKAARFTSDLSQSPEPDPFDHSLGVVQVTSKSGTSCVNPRALSLDLSLKPPSETNMNVICHASGGDTEQLGHNTIPFASRSKAQAADKEQDVGEARIFSASVATEHLSETALIQPRVEDSSPAEGVEAFNRDKSLIAAKNKRVITLPKGSSSTLSPAPRAKTTSSQGDEDFRSAVPQSANTKTSNALCSVNSRLVRAIVGESSMNSAESSWEPVRSYLLLGGRQQAAQPDPYSAAGRKRVNSYAWGELNLQQALELINEFAPSSKHHELITQISDNRVGRGGTLPAFAEVWSVDKYLEWILFNIEQCHLLKPASMPKLGDLVDWKHRPQQVQVEASQPVEQTALAVYLSGYTIHRRSKGFPVFRESLDLLTKVDTLLCEPRLRGLGLLTKFTTIFEKLRQTLETEVVPKLSRRTRRRVDTDVQGAKDVSIMFINKIIMLYRVFTAFDATEISALQEEVQTALVHIEAFWDYFLGAGLIKESENWQQNPLILAAKSASQSIYKNFYTYTMTDRRYLLTVALFTDWLSNFHNSIFSLVGMSVSKSSRTGFYNFLADMTMANLMESGKSD